MCVSHSGAQSYCYLTCSVVFSAILRKKMRLHSLPQMWLVRVAVLIAMELAILLVDLDLKTNDFVTA